MSPTPHSSAATACLPQIDSPRATKRRGFLPHFTRQNPLGRRRHRHTTAAARAFIIAGFALLGGQGASAAENPGGARQKLTIPGLNYSVVQLPKGTFIMGNDHAES